MKFAGWISKSRLHAISAKLEWGLIPLMAMTAHLFPLVLYFTLPNYAWEVSFPVFGCVFYFLISLILAGTQLFKSPWMNTAGLLYPFFFGFSLAHVGLVYLRPGLFFVHEIHLNGPRFTWGAYWECYFRVDLYPYIWQRWVYRLPFVLSIVLVAYKFLTRRGGPDSDDIGFDTKSGDWDATAGHLEDR